MYQAESAHLCSVCHYSMFGNRPTVLGCGHTMCAICLRYTHNGILCCPVCHTPVNWSATDHQMDGFFRQWDAAERVMPMQDHLSAMNRHLEQSAAAAMAEKQQLDVQLNQIESRKLPLSDERRQFECRFMPYGMLGDTIANLQAQIKQREERIRNLQSSIAASENKASDMRKKLEESVKKTREMAWRVEEGMSKLKAEMKNLERLQESFPRVAENASNALEQIANAGTA